MTLIIKTTLLALIILVAGCGKNGSSESDFITSPRSHSFGQFNISINPVQTNLSMPGAVTLQTDIDAEITGEYIQSYQWQVSRDRIDITDNNSQTATLLQPINGPGDYLFTLTVVDDQGDSYSQTLSRTLTNNAPFPVISASSYATEQGSSLLISASQTTDPESDSLTYEWYFSDNPQIVNGAEVSHTFNQKGQVVVQLTVTDTVGNSAIATKTFSISDFVPSPIAQFNLNIDTLQTEVTMPGTVILQTDIDAALASQHIENYHWQVSRDGTDITSNENQNPTLLQAINEPGDYEFSLTVVDDLGDSYSETLSKTFTNNAPFSVINADRYSAEQGNSLLLSASQSTDPVNDTLTYQWYFSDDQQTSSDIEVSHKFNVAGTVTVQLTVTDTAGNSTIETKIFSISDPVPSPVAQYNLNIDTQLQTDISMPADVTLQTDIAAATASQHIQSYQWQVSLDGTDITDADNQNETLLQTITQPGSYRFTLTAVDTQGKSHSRVLERRFTKLSPLTGFNILLEPGSTNIPIPGLITLKTNIDPATAVQHIKKYQWTVTHNSKEIQSTSEQNNRELTQPIGNLGNYIISLTLTDYQGDTYSQTLAKDFVANTPPTPVIDAESFSVIAGNSLTLNSLSSTDLEDDLENVSLTYQWYFPDNEEAPTDSTVTHLFNQPGKIQVRLIATDTAGNIAVTTKVFDVTETSHNSPPAASFAIKNESLQTVQTSIRKETLTFDASSSTDPNDDIEKFVWHFGDKDNTTRETTGSSVEFDYNELGSIYVTLIVEDASGNQGQAVREIIINNIAPKSEFTVSSLEEPSGTLITFDASASLDPDGHILRYLWDFGDDTKSKSTQSTISHVYQTPCECTVTLTVMDSSGHFNKHTLETPIVITNVAPTAKFTIEDEFSQPTTEVNRAREFTFNPQLSSDPDGDITQSTFHWDFGDGNTETTTGRTTVTHQFEKDLPVGTYLITLTVTDACAVYIDCALTGENEQQVEVINLPPIVNYGDVTFGDGAKVPPLWEINDTTTIDFSEAISDIDSTKPIEYSWTINDTPHLETSAVLKEQFSSSGFHIIVLSITDSDGGVTTTPFEVLISEPTPTDIEISGLLAINNGHDTDSELQSIYVSNDSMGVETLYGPKELNGYLNSNDGDSVDTYSINLKQGESIHILSEEFINYSLTANGTPCSGTPAVSPGDQVIFTCGSGEFNAQTVYQLSVSSHSAAPETKYLIKIKAPEPVQQQDTYSDLWNLDKINTATAQSKITNPKPVTVAIIDTGIFNDADFTGQLTDDGFNFEGDGINLDGSVNAISPIIPFDQAHQSDFHGSHMAGIISAKKDNGIGISGVAPEAKLRIIRALSSNDPGNQGKIADAIRYAAGLDSAYGHYLTAPKYRADVINLSFGQAYSAPLEQAIKAARGKGSILVSAAGNSATTESNYPASFTEVLSVSAITQSNKLACYSNTNSEVVITAPGGEVPGAFLVSDPCINSTERPREAAAFGDGIRSIYNPATYFFAEGTSQAAAHVSGVIALMKAANPSITPDDIDTLIKDPENPTQAGYLTSPPSPVNADTDDPDLMDNIKDSKFGFGLIDAEKAVQKALDLAEENPIVLTSTTESLDFGLAHSQATISIMSSASDPSISLASPTSYNSWLEITSSDTDSYGFGEYQISIDREHVDLTSNKETHLRFTASNDDVLFIPVTVSVQPDDNSADLGTVHFVLINTDDIADPDAPLPLVNVAPHAVNTGTLVNGVYQYSFTNPPDNYRLIAGTDIDNDGYICDFAELCTELTAANGTTGLTPAGSIDTVNLETAFSDSDNNPKLVTH